jgi:hypothetical protein
MAFWHGILVWAMDISILIWAFTTGIVQAGTGIRNMGMGVCIEAVIRLFSWQWLRASRRVRTWASGIGTGMRQGLPSRGRKRWIPLACSLARRDRVVSFLQVGERWGILRAEIPRTDDGQMVSGSWSLERGIVGHKRGRIQVETVRS